MTVDWAAFADLPSTQRGPFIDLVEHGRIIDTRSYGRTRPFGELLPATTPLNGGSIAKQFTGAAIALLTVDGVLNVEDSVRHWQRDV